MTHGKAIKKPIPIDWFKFTSDIKALSEWLSIFDAKLDDHFILGGSKVKVKTLEGTSYDLPDGYIVIRGIKNEYYPCDPTVFKESYDIL